MSDSEGSERAPTPDRKKTERRVPRWVDLASLGALFSALLAATWRRWPDPLVDFWRNLYVPWRMSEGALLYVDVADWYGPLPHLVASAAFSLFGPGLDVLLALNALVALACLVTLHATLLGLGDRRSAWVGAAAFVLVFCFGQYTVLGNYNFMTPYVSQATWGFLGVLLALHGSLENVTEDSARGWLLAGVGLSVAWLTKAEAAFAAVLILSAANGLRRRLPSSRLLVGAAAVAAPMALLLLALGGPSYAWRAFHHAVAFPLQPHVRATIAAVPIFTTDLGTDAPLANLAALLLSGGALLALIAGTAWLTQWKGRASAVVAVLIAAGVVVFVDPLQLGRSWALPALLTAGVATGAAARGEARWRGLALFALAGLAMLPRMALQVRLYHYGFTMAVLVAALAVHLLVFEAPRFFGQAPRWLGWLAAGVVLALSGRLTAHSLTMHAAKTLPVGEGRDAIMAFGPQAQRHGALVNELVAAVNSHAPDARTLVVFPDSAAVSYLTRKPSPIPQFEFNPVSLGFSDEAAVIARLEASPPDVVMLCSYDLRTHGTQFFGGTPASGQALASWVKRNYRVVASGAPGPFSVTGRSWDLLVRRAP